MRPSVLRCIKAETKEIPATTYLEGGVVYTNGRRWASLPAANGTEPVLTSEADAPGFR